MGGGKGGGVRDTTSIRTKKCKHPPRVVEEHFQDVTLDRTAGTTRGCGVTPQSKGITSSNFQYDTTLRMPRFV